MKKIGFIGIGVMGHSIVMNMMKNNLTVSVYNRTKSKTDDLVKEGAVWRDTPKDIVENSEIIFTMVGFPSDVEDIYFKKDGIFDADVTNKILVDLTTSTPSLAEKIGAEAAERGGSALDAPVSGGDLGAKNGTLTIMVGGSEDAYNEVVPVFKTFGKTVNLQGSSGKGQHTKMANQIMIAGTMTGMSEMLVYAEKSGLNLDKVIETLGGGSASNWSMNNYAPRILKADYSPGFFVKHFIKDLRIALDEAEKMNLKLPATKLAEELYTCLADKGFEDDGTQALIKLWWD
ncbi:NAD(P)-dependent oxidoreductase [Enterococcus sp. BWT-B8]|uniref:NAD(P)-dependent oxidoreductase n=1 Tax=unclassified Enterococcus TaxID=2608891 RepID=UPI001E313B6C|nr:MULTISPECIES: NAD(P)-dependent oxidoreductase [unclassified Enterococcus]MCB5952162.1 NAD(P)-dependent oxidoreductase [Enterococcus sp. BWT-B8]MCB5956001.1 NAD(P)-dependent oxidoreductase [Enterococcus sp. CWB-B31]